MTEEEPNAVHYRRATDAFLFADFTTDKAWQEDFSDWAEVKKPTHAAGVSHFLRGLSEHVAGTEQSTDANVAVVKATEHAVLEFSRHDWIVKW